MTNYDILIKANLTEISSFLDRYRDFSKRLERQKIVHYKTKFDGFLSGYGSLKNIVKAIDRKEARGFNIFNILNIRFSEIKAHTPFLKNLLNPNGSHGQGGLFLNSFIQELIPQEKRKHFELNNFSNYNIIEEKPIHNGRIDIYIHSLDPKRKFNIIIENKLFAGDQQDQIKRYYKFLHGGKELKNDEIMIFYLTITGVDPSAFSIEEELREKLKNNKVLKNISYNGDIKNWLTNLIQDVQSNKVKDLIIQYLNILKTL